MGFLFREFGKARALIMTQEELARKSGVKVSQIKNYECGRRKAHVSDVVLMCDALGFNFDDYYKKDSVVLTFLSNKGGSCKTTDSVNISYMLATKLGKKVLLIDSDMQQNSGQHLKVPFDNEKNIYQALIKRESLEYHIRPTQFENLDIISSHDGMSTMETEIAVSQDVREQRISKILRPIKEKGIYDFIIFDTNPLLGQLNRAILFATDGVIIPLEASAFGLRGLEYLVNYIKVIKDDCETLKILGVLVNNLDLRKKVPKEVIKLAEESLGDKNLVFKSQIKTDSSIPQAQMYNEPIGVSFAKSRAYSDFLDAAEEVIERSKKVILNG